jgi:uncharacterized protein YndB with AHSA1/START domain
MADILHVVDIHASANAVFQTVGSVEGIRRWWSISVEGSDDVGGIVTIRFGDQWKVVMKRVNAVPNERVAYRITEHDSDEWPGTELVFDLSDNGDWTILKFDQRGWASSSDFFRFCSAKWVVFLLSIKQAAESGMGTPYPNETKIGRTD